MKQHIAPTVVIRGLTYERWVNAEHLKTFDVIDPHIQSLIKAKQLKEQCKELSAISELRNSLDSELLQSLNEFLWGIVLGTHDTETLLDLELQTNFYKLLISTILLLIQPNINSKILDLIYRHFNSGRIHSTLNSLSDNAILSNKIGLSLQLILEKLASTYPSTFQDLLNTKLLQIIQIFSDCIQSLSFATLSGTFLTEIH
jgi:hypothetical protein